MEFYIVFSYFDKIIGPTVFYTYPKEKLNENEACIVANLMDQMISEGFFTYSFNGCNTLNYYFEIDSEWARGYKEFLMISVIFKDSISAEIEKVVFSLCNEFSEWLKERDDIFIAFYKNYNSENQNKQITNNNEKKMVKTWIKELYLAIIDEVQEKHEEGFITTLLEKKSVIETLDYLSKNPSPIIDLKTWYNERFPHENFYKTITNLYKQQIVDVPKRGGKRKAPFNVYVRKEVKTIVNLIILKNKLIKEFIKNNIIENTRILEKNAEEFHVFLKSVFSEKQIV
ncbi:MAG: hypothetical protein ACFFD5_07875 [Candidatus Thorarchaeota archaeon]